jgi:hypothetical protein
MIPDESFHIHVKKVPVKYKKKFSGRIFKVKNRVLPKVFWNNISGGKQRTFRWAFILPIEK